MMVPITSNSNEDSQGPQLRVSKKLATVCSGKRSRFSKPRPNLSICKRGETVAPAGAAKTSEKTLNGNASNQPLKADIDKRSVERDCKVGQNNVLPHEDAIEKVIEKDIEIVPLEDANKIVVEQQPSQIIQSSNLEKLVPEEDLHVISCAVSGKLSSDEDNQVISNIGVEKSTSKESIQDTTSTNDNDTSKENNIQGSPLKNSSDISEENNIQRSSVKNSSDISEENNIQRSPVKNSSNTSEENNIQTSPVKNSRSPLITPEKERRVLSSTAPTVIDKSKYPHLTSILSKKRTEPRKEVQQKRRRKFKKGDAPPERSKMTMADLIYWNPVKTDEPPKNTSTVNETLSISHQVAVEEESIDDPVENENNIMDSVPKLVISEDGQINIDQSSLFVSRNIPQPISTEVVRKDDTTYSSFRKRPLTKHWTAKDTANFYRALSLVGADFSLMEQIFPNRSRRELKQKFKREEKFNIDLINKVLYESQTFDEQTLDAFMDQNSVVDDPVITNEKENPVKEKSRKPKTPKKEKSVVNETGDSSMDHPIEETEAEKPENKRGRKKKAKKLSDDEDVRISITTDCANTGEYTGSKRKRNAKKLPDDFVSIDSIESLDFLDDLVTDDVLDAFAKENSVENQENSAENQENSLENQENNAAEENPSESAYIIFDKIMNGTENVDIQQNFKEEICNVTAPLPVVTNDDEEYISVEYIKNDNSDADLSMLRNVVAYEVVNTQTPVPKKKRKMNSISPIKTRDYLVTTKISPTNYTTFTPV